MALTLGVAALIGPGCTRPAVRTEPAAVETSRADAGFLAPPTPLSGTRMAQGGVRLVGRAPPRSTVTLASPEGARLQADTGTDGTWAVEIASAAAPRLFALSAQLGDRVLRGEGAVVVTPPDSAVAALLLRSSGAAWPIEGASNGAARLASVDFDAGGGFAASGAARPGATVRLMLDGGVAGQGQADATGRFAVLALAAPASAGAHGVSVASPYGGEVRTVIFAASGPLTAPYRAVRANDGWRIDWTTPGGGVQSVLVFDRQAPSGPGKEVRS